ncbi:hypothetical protein [Paracoccus aminophilus]|uniref:hypothetical protein n=1 Tax=Paracoccus aminophilus TaxID=34003 RepID=UPI0011DD7FDE|nr:hypothetical protein [Paracoccus aminophilus]
MPQPTTRRETLIVLVNLLRAIGDRGVSPEQAAEIGHRAEILKKPTRKQRCAGAAWLLERAVACGLAVKDDSGAFRPLLHNLPRSLEAPTTARGAWFCEFTHCPEIGTRIVRRDGLGFVLVAAEPYTRKSDGAASFLLTWLSDDGRKATTGLRSSSVRWQRSEVR